MRLVVATLCLTLLIAPACQTSSKIPCPTDESTGGLFGFLKKKKQSNATTAIHEGEGQGDPAESATAAQADAGRSVGGGGYKEDKHGLIKRKKYKNLHAKPRTGQHSFLGITF